MGPLTQDRQVFSFVNKNIFYRSMSGRTEIGWFLMIKSNSTS